MSGNGNKRIEELFKAAEEEGKISPAGMRALNLVDPGAQIQAALGARVEDVPSSEVVLVTIMPDDSGSIGASRNAQAVRDGHNLVLDALAKSKQKCGVLVHTRYLNGAVLYPYTALDGAVTMDASNYEPTLGTPLYDQTVIVLGTVLAKAQEFEDAGVAVRTVTLLITDGADEHSTRARARDVAAVVGDMARAETHIVAAMGIQSGATDFRRVFREMGVEDRWILTPGSSASEIRKAFQVFSQSAVRVSQGAVSASKTALGGFAG
jgi:hypothetical protein